MTSAVDATALEHLMQALAEVLNETGQFLASKGHKPVEDSIAAWELVKFPGPELVATAYGQADILIQVAAEQVTCFIRACTEPALTIAPLSAVRAVLESCALASWLLDPLIDAESRVKRSLAFRYDGLDQQVKMARVARYPGGLEASSRRIESVEQSALKVGIGPVVDKKGKRIGIGEVMPPITILTDQTLGEEATYRLLSAVTHAHPWALQKLSFNILRIEGTPPTDSSSGRASPEAFLHKAAKPLCFQYLAHVSMKAFTKPVLYKAKLFGWEPGLLEARIEVHRQRITELAEAIAFDAEAEEGG